MSLLHDLGLNGLALLWGVLLLVVSFTLSMAVLVFVLTRLPATYFRGPHSPPFWAQRQPMLRWAGLAGKNLLGVLLVLLGIFLSLPAIPGQGLLTILIGIMLLNFPGKRRLEQRLVSRPKVLRAINWLRDRFGRSPLELDIARPTPMPSGQPCRSLAPLVRIGSRCEGGTAMKLHLVVVKGVPVGREIPISGMPRLVIGRSDQCHLCPTSNLISRRHCEIVQHEGGVFVHDWESTNGTYVNDLRVGGVVEVHDGDRLRVGPLVFQFKITGPGQGPSRGEAEDCPWHLRSGRSGAALELP